MKLLSNSDSKVWSALAKEASGRVGPQAGAAPRVYEIIREGDKTEKVPKTYVKNDPDTRILFILPGSTEGAAKETSADNAVKTTLALMDHYNIDLRGVRIYTCTYYHPYPRERTQQNVDSLKEAPTRYISPDAQIIVKSLLPMICKDYSYDDYTFFGERLPFDELRKNLSRVTLFGKSKGTLLCREIENALAVMMAELTYDKQEIDGALEQLFSVGVANIFAVDTPEQRSSGVFFTGVNDSKAAKYFPGFEEYVHIEGQKTLRVQPICNGKGVLVACNIPNEMYLLGPNGEPVFYEDPNGHSFNSYAAIRYKPEENIVPLAVVNAVAFGLSRSPFALQQQPTETLVRTLFVRDPIRDIGIAHELESIRKPKALFWVESLVGGGHINYAGGVAHELSKLGYEVFLCSGSRVVKGGAKIPGVKNLDLPALSGDFKTGIVTTQNGMPIEEDAAWRDHYAAELAAFFDRVKPDILVTEFWPVRRGVLSFALDPVVQRASESGCHIHCLLRDYVHMSVTNTAHGGGDPAAAEYIKKYYTAVLVHTLRELMTLNNSMDPQAVGIMEGITHYTGYIVPRYENESNPQNNIPTVRDKIIVTSGSGWTDYSAETTRAITEHLIQSLSEGHHKGKKVHVLIPNEVGTESGKKADIFFAELVARVKEAGVDDRIIVERNRPDFSKLLKEAEAIFCHGGNTIVEAVDAGVSYVHVTPRLTPGDVRLEGDMWMIRNGNTQEQLHRTVALANAGFINLITPEEVAEANELTKSIIGFSNQQRHVLALRGDALARGGPVAASLIDEMFQAHQRGEGFVPSRQGGYKVG